VLRRLSNIFRVPDFVTSPVHHRDHLPLPGGANIPIPGVSCPRFSCCSLRRGERVLGFLNSSREAR